MNKSKQGYVYILSSVNCNCIKIGGTDYPPIKRIKEINNTEPYKSLGRWELADFRQVTDWRAVEHQLHYSFRSKLNIQQANQKELFDLSIKEAVSALNEIDDEFILYKPKVDRMFHDQQFRGYLKELFVFSGLTHWLEYQGAWTFVLFPGTNGGRYFTLNIGSHEVAFSTLGKGNSLSVHMILMDKLITESSEILMWLRQHNGCINQSHYKTALPRAVLVFFEGSFEVAQAFLRLQYVRRALIAYWHDALFTLKDHSKASVYARFHNYNAVAKLNEWIKE